jgi:hypothetical protein
MAISNWRASELAATHDGNALNSDALNAVVEIYDRRQQRYRILGRTVL